MRRSFPLLLALAVCLVAGVHAGPAGAQTDTLDLLIRGGRVLDGTGNPWYRADVGIRDGWIVAVGALEGSSARDTIDASGRLVAPGFIDIHSHADDARPGGLRAGANRRAAPNLVAQGVTTVVVNHDGRSPWPVADQRSVFDQRGVGPNVAALVGHGTVRSRAMADDVQRPATAEEVDRMRRLVRQAMDEGAYGLSAGLEYSPGRWSEIDEVVALVEEVVPYGGVYVSHQRSEGGDPMWYWPSRDPATPPTLLDAVRETIEIGERTGATVVASHIKAKGARYWGTSQAAIELIQSARDRGVSVYADQYPYATSGTDGNTRLLPDWVFGDVEPGDDGRRDYRVPLRRALADASTAAALRRDIAHEIERRGGADRVVVFDHPDADWIGKSIGEIARARGIEPVELAIALQLEGFSDRPGGARLRGFSMAEDDVDAYARQPWVATASDAGIALPDDGPVHARFYGTFPRKLRRTALDRRVIGIEHAIRSMTSLPAQILGLRDRGLVREGYHADLVVLDPDRVRDTATFVDPHQYPEGIDHVLVGGEAVVADGELTGALPGRFLTPPGRSGQRSPPDS